MVIYERAPQINLLSNIWNWISWQKDSKFQGCNSIKNIWQGNILKQLYSITSSVLESSLFSIALPHFQLYYTDIFLLPSKPHQHPFPFYHCFGSQFATNFCYDSFYTLLKNFTLFCLIQTLLSEVYLFSKFYFCFKIYLSSTLLYSYVKHFSHKTFHSNSYKISYQSFPFA